jgi:hypothetical protein
MEENPLPNTVSNYGRGKIQKAYRNVEFSMGMKQAIESNYLR